MADISNKKSKQLARLWDGSASASANHRTTLIESSNSSFHSIKQWTLCASISRTMPALLYSCPGRQQLWYESAKLCEQRYKTNAFRGYDNFTKFSRYKSFISSLNNEFDSITWITCSQPRDVEVG